MVAAAFRRLGAGPSLPKRRRAPAFLIFISPQRVDDIGIAVATIGVAASLLNSGTTKALTPKRDAPEAESVATVRNFRQLTQRRPTINPATANSKAVIKNALPPSRRR